MRGAAVLALVLLAGFTGYLVGRGTRAAGRGGEAIEHVPPRTQRRRVELPADELAEIRKRAARVDGLVAENEKLRAIVAKLAPASAEEPPAGTRREDGTIVGGARWPKITRDTALGFIWGRMEAFFKEAGLDEDQKARLRLEMERRIGQALQNAADFVNGDITADQAYEGMEAVATDGRKMLTGVLDENQLEIYRRFEQDTTRFVHTNVVNNEMATLRKELDLDREQEKKVRAVVEERFRRVQDRLSAPIPNMFFKPMRRDRDHDIYQETGGAIRALLNARQAAAFDAVEAKAATALYGYRTLLIPKAP